MNDSFSYYRKMLIVLGGITLLAVVFAGVKYVAEKKQRAQISELEEHLLTMQTTLNLDSYRQHEIQAIISTINRYNTGMPQHQKYEIANELFAMTEKYENITTDLLLALISFMTRGTWDPNLSTDSGAMGLMQIMPVTGLFVAAREDIVWESAEEVLLNPINNIRIGCRYLSTLIDLYNVEGGLAAYCSSERRAARWHFSGKKYGLLSKETRSEIAYIQRLWEEHQNQR